jgi:hypothetical protein
VWPQSTRKCCIVLPGHHCRRGLSAQPSWTRAAIQALRKLFISYTMS